MSRGRRIGVAIAALTSLVLFTAGCTGGNSKGPAAAQAPNGVPRNEINPVAYADVKAGGTLNYPMSGPIANFNRYELDGANADTEAVVGAILPSLFTIDAGNVFTPDPDYLTGEPTVATSPAQTITYNVNPSAKWSDGTPISYRDFVSQWLALNASNPDFTLSSPADYTDIASVARGATDQQVVVTMKAGTVDADWRGLFSPLYPTSATETPAAFNTGWKDKPLVSAGPFIFSGGDATGYTLVRNPSWWGRTARLNSIVFKVEPTTQAATAALQAHQIDVQDVGLDAPTYAEVKALPGIAMRHAAGPDTRDITINGSRAPFTDVTLRQAIAMGIDRDAIARTQLTPLGIPTATAPDSHIFLAGQPGYKDNAGAVGAYNPTKAAQMLTADGWIDDPATQIRTKEGKPLTVQFVVPAGTAQSLSDAQLVQQQLAKIDVGVTIKNVDLPSFFNGYIAPGNFDMTVFSWLGGNFPITDASVIYQPEQPGDDWARNYSHVSVPELSTLFRQAESDLDQAAAAAAANQADQIIWQNVMTLPLYQAPDIWATTATLANFGAFGFATVDWTAVGFTA